MLTWVNWTLQGHLICLAASWSLDPRKLSCRWAALSETMGLLTPIKLRSRLHFCRLRTFGSVLLQDSAFCWCNFSTVTTNMPRPSFFDQQVKVFLRVITVVTKGKWVAQLLPLSHLLRLPLFSSKKTVASANSRRTLFTFLKSCKFNMKVPNYQLWKKGAFPNQERTREQEATVLHGTNF